MRLVNIGCGKNPINGFINYDNNIFLFLHKLPFLKSILEKFSFIPLGFIQLMEIATKKEIKYCNGSKRIPERIESVDLIYCCHMIEHLDHEETDNFFMECKLGC